MVVALVVVVPSWVRPTRTSTPEANRRCWAAHAHHPRTPVYHSATGQGAGVLPEGPNAIPSAPRTMTGTVPSTGRRRRTVTRPAAREHSRALTQGMTAGPR